MSKKKNLFCEVNVFYNKGMKLLMRIYVSVAKISSWKEKYEKIELFQKAAEK